MKGPLALIPPLGVRINTDTLPRGVRIRARARWTDPVSGIRESRSVSVDSEALACEFFSALRSHVGADLDPFITLTNYADQIGDRFLRGVDMTSTASGYGAGLRLRALPALGNLRIRDITTGIEGRSIDSWEIEHSRSTLKNAIAALSRVLDEAVRDEIITRNPVRERAQTRRRLPQHLVLLLEEPDSLARFDRSGPRRLASRSCAARRCGRRPHRFGERTEPPKHRPEYGRPNHPRRRAKSNSSSRR